MKKMAREIAGYVEDTGEGRWTIDAAIDEDVPAPVITQALYAHLDTTAVQPGAKVTAGEVIGTVGVTGFSTGPHLHFQLRQNGRAIDPATVLAGLDQHATRPNGSAMA